MAESTLHLRLSSNRSGRLTPSCRSSGFCSAAGSVTPREETVKRELTQTTIMLGRRAITQTDPDYFPLAVASYVLGGGSASRLYTRVREESGLAYSVYSYASQYADAGAFGVYAGCQPKKLREVIDLCRTEIANLVATGITDTELALGIGQLRGGMVLGLEDTGSRMSRIGKGELVYGEHMSVDTVLDLIAGVTLDDVRAVAADLLTAAPAVAVIGPYKDPSAFIS